MTEPLIAWLYDVPVAEITASGAGRMRMEFTTDAVARWGVGSPILSVALPIAGSSLDSHSWLTNLLPDGAGERALLSAEYGLVEDDAMALLGAIGRDCAGAVSVVAASADPPGAGSVQPLSDAEVLDAVRQLPRHPLGAGQRTRVSLAGNQPKLLLARTVDGGWGRPLDGHPSTHLLKPEPLDLSNYAGNEVFCMRLARLVGLTTVDVELLIFGGRPTCCVERYDRSTDAAGRVIRLHQEDFAQATGRTPGAKYERIGEHRLREIATLVHRFGGTNEAIRVLEMAAFHVAIGNADAHSKNFSLLHPADGSVRLAPMYDATNTVVSASTDTTLAMSIATQTSIHAVAADDLADEAASWKVRGLTRRRALHVVTALLESTRAQISTAEQPLWVDEEIVEAITTRVQRLLDRQTAGDASAER